MHWSWFRIAAAVISPVRHRRRIHRQHRPCVTRAQDLELVLVNYFSLFTIVSALLSVVALVAAATWAQRHPGTTREPLGIALGLAAVAGRCCFSASSTTCCCATPPAASPSATPRGSDCWTPTRSRCCTSCCRSTSSSICCWRRDVAGCRGGRSPSSSRYPLGWTVYTMVRGAAGLEPRRQHAWWYPYPFLDPHNAGLRVGLRLHRRDDWSAFLAIGAVIIAIGRYREKRAAMRGGAAPPPAPCTSEHASAMPGRHVPTRHRARPGRATGRAAPRSVDSKACRRSCSPSPSASASASPSPGDSTPPSPSPGCATRARSPAPTRATSVSPTRTTSTRSRAARSSTAPRSRAWSTARPRSSKRASAPSRAAPSTSARAARPTSTPRPLGRAVTGTLLVRAMKDDGVDIWGDGSTYKGNDIERFYRYGLLANPAPAHLQAVARRRLRHRARRPLRDVGSGSSSTASPTATAPRRRTRPTRTSGARPTRPRPSSTSTSRSRPSSRSWACGSGTRRSRSPPRTSRSPSSSAARSRSTASSTPTPVELVHEANRIGGRHGLGMSDQIENRIIEAKSRGIYEAPAHGAAVHRLRAPGERHPERRHPRDLPRAGPPARPADVRGALARAAVAHAARVDPEVGRLDDHRHRSRCACAAARTTRSSTPPARTCRTRPRSSRWSASATPRSARPTASASSRCATSTSPTRARASSSTPASGLIGGATGALVGRITAGEADEITEHGRAGAMPRPKRSTTPSKRHPSRRCSTPAPTDRPLRADAPGCRTDPTRAVVRVVRVAAPCGLRCLTVLARPERVAPRIAVHDTASPRAHSKVLQCRSPPPRPRRSTAAEPPRRRSVGRIIGVTVFGIVAGVIVIALIAAGFVVWTIQRSFPQLEGTIAVEGLGDDVDGAARRARHPDDHRRQTPTTSSSRRGTCTRRTASGRWTSAGTSPAGALSELFGESQLATDKFLRTLGWREIAEQEVEALDPTVAAYYDAYADGRQRLPRRPRRRRRVVRVRRARAAEPRLRDRAVDARRLGGVAEGDGLGPPHQHRGRDRARDRSRRTSRPSQIDELYPEYPFDRNPVIVPTITAVAAGERGRDRPPKRRSPPRRSSGARSTASIEAVERAASATPAKASARTRGSSRAISPRAGCRCWRTTRTSAPIAAQRVAPGRPASAASSAPTARSTSRASASRACRASIIGHNDRIAWGFTNLTTDVTDLYLEKIQGDSVLARRRARAARGAHRDDRGRRRRGRRARDPLDRARSDRLGADATTSPRSRPTPTPAPTGIGRRARPARPRASTRSA